MKFLNVYYVEIWNADIDCIQLHTLHSDDWVALIFFTFQLCHSMIWILQEYKTEESTVIPSHSDALRNRVPGIARWVLFTSQHTRIDAYCPPIDGTVS